METLNANPDTVIEANLMGIESNDNPAVEHIMEQQEHVDSISSNLDFPKVETSVSGPLSFDLEPDTFVEANLMEVGSNDHHAVDHIMEQQEHVDSTSGNLPKVETFVSGPLSFDLEPLAISTRMETLKADPETSVEAKMMEVESNDHPAVEHIMQQQEHVDSIASNFDFPKVETSVSGPLSADSQLFMPQLQSTVSYGYSVGKGIPEVSRPRSLHLTGKRKSPPESTDSLNKRVEPVHHRPWLQQFYSESNWPDHMSSPNTEDPPMPSKRVRQKEVMNKKQTDLSQNSKNEENNPLRSKMKESLAAALALVHEQEDSPKDKKNPEAQEVSVPVTESNETTSVPLAEGIIEPLSARDGSNETKMNYVNQSDVQNEFNEVFPCDGVPFGDSFFSSDELLQGNGLSWVMENETNGEKPFEDPNLLATKIELELFKLFGGVNKKYKEKGRSLLFNLKDKNNPELRESVMSGKITPERLCSMTAEELASKELSQWRQAKAEEMAKMVVLQDADIDVRRLVRKTHKGEFQVEEVDTNESGIVDDVSVGISTTSRPRVRTKSAKLSKNDKTKSNQTDMTVPSTEETDPMQGLSMDDELKDVGFLPPIVSLDEFMESLNSELPFGSPQQGNDVKEEAPTSPKLSPKEAGESVSPTTKLEEANNVISPKPDAGVKLDADASQVDEVAPLVASVKEDQIWDGILQLSASSVVSVTGIFKSGEKAKTSEWPTLVEVKGRVRLAAFGKFVKELPLSRSRVLMVMNVVCKDGISQSQRDSLAEVVKSYVADQRVGYAEPTSGVELYLCPPCGETLDLLTKIISKDHLDEIKSSENIGLIGIVVWRRAVVVTPPVSRRKPGSKRHHSKSSVSAPENKKSTTSVKVAKEPVVASVIESHSPGGVDVDEDDMPPGFGPDVTKDDDDLPEFNFNSSTGPVQALLPPPPLSRPMSQVRELIFKYGNTVGNGSTQSWNDDDDDDDIPEWQPEISTHQVQLPPPPPLPDFRTELDPRFHNRTMGRSSPTRRPPGPQGEWRANHNDPRQQQQYSARRNRGL